MKEEILSRLPRNHPWCHRIHYYDVIESTNTEAKRMAQAGAPEGTVLIADTQTGGRGRLGRSFHSPAGSGIYMSVILRPNMPPDQLMHLTCAVAVALCDAVEQTLGFRPGIKWINDLVVDTKKLAGILTELSVNSQGLVDWAIVGIGLNCNQTSFPPELQDIACSATMVTGQPIDWATLSAAIIQALFQMDLTNPRQTMALYRNDCVTLGRDVTVIRGTQMYDGRAVEIQDDGALTVLRRDGQTEIVNSGEVSVRGLFGYA